MKSERKLGPKERVAFDPATAEPGRAEGSSRDPDPAILRPGAGASLVQTLRAADAGTRTRVVEQLQRDLGNAWVMRAVTTGDKPSTAEPAKPIDARAMLAEKYPHLLKVLATDQIASLQKLYDARAELKRLEKEWEAAPGTVSSEDTAKRARIEDKIHEKGRTIKANEVIVVPTELLLADDVLGGAKAKDESKESAQEAAFKDNLYKELISHPARILVQEEGEFQPLHIYWGPAGWRLYHSGGLLKFQDLMKIEKWNIAYQQILMGRMVKISEEMLELRREMGGALYDVYGKKLGEIWGHVWNTDVEIGQEVGKIGGYVDDSRGEIELMSEMYKAKGGGKVVLQAPDGWLHLYNLKDPNIKSWIQLTSPFDDGMAYIFAWDSEVKPSSVRQILTADAMELKPMSTEKGLAWGCKVEGYRMGTIEQFAVGAIFGDWFEEGTAASTVGQIFIGVIPIVGQIADARDVAAGVYKVWETGGKDGKLQTAMALVGFVPLLGDAVKSGRKAGGKVAKEVIEEAAPKVEREFARKLADDPLRAAKHFGVEVVKGAEEKMLKEGAEKVGKALAERGPAAEALAKEAKEAFEAMGGDAAGLVRRYGGDWATLAKALAFDPKGVGKTLGNEMQVWRMKKVDKLKTGLESGRKEIEGALGRSVGPPEFTPTGSKGFMSDIDLNFYGKDASAYRSHAIRLLEEELGTSWDEVRKLLDISAFTDPSRLYLFMDVAEEIGGKGVKKIEKELVKEAELNALSKMIREGAGEAEVKSLAKKIGVDFDDVAKRVKEVEALAADPAAIRRLELKMDDLHAKFERLKTTDPKAAAEVAKEMAITQGKLNTLDEYVTPGGVYKLLGLREPELRKKMGDMTGKELMSPAMRYMAVLDDLQMLSHTLVALKKAGGFTADLTKDMSKYAYRLTITAGQLGALDIAKVAKARELFDLVDDLFAGAKKVPPTLAAEAGTHLEQARKLLLEQIEDVLKVGAEKAGKGRRLEDIEDALKALKTEYELLRDAAVVFRAVRERGEGEPDTGE